MIDTPSGEYGMEAITAQEADKRILESADSCIEEALPAMINELAQRGIKTREEFSAFMRVDQGRYDELVEEFGAGRVNNTAVPVLDKYTSAVLRKAGIAPAEFERFGPEIKERFVTDLLDSLANHQVQNDDTYVESGVTHPHVEVSADKGADVEKRDNDALDNIDFASNEVQEIFQYVEDDEIREVRSALCELEGAMPTEFEEETEEIRGFLERLVSIEKLCMDGRIEAMDVSNKAGALPLLNADILKRMKNCESLLGDTGRSVHEFTSDVQRWLDTVSQKTSENDEPVFVSAVVSNTRDKVNALAEQVKRAKQVWSGSVDTVSEHLEWVQSVEAK